VVLAAAGDVPTREILATAYLPHRHLPSLRVRVVNMVDKRNEHHTYVRCTGEDLPEIRNWSWPGPG
jgi:phosphoketolase